MQLVKRFSQMCCADKPVDEQIMNFLNQNKRFFLQNASLSVSPEGEEIALAIFEFEPLIAK